jgi:chitinase
MFASRSSQILLPLLLLTGAFGQSRSISIAIFPAEATLHVEQVQTFTAVIMGTNDGAIKWAVLEPSGGTITDDGVYTAPESIGIYHVVAVAMSNGERAQTVVKVTVVTHYDTPPNP